MVKEAGQFSHGKIVAGAHEGEFEKPDYHRRERVILFVLKEDVNHQPPGCHVGHLIAQFFPGNSELSGEAAQGDRFDGNILCEPGFIGGKKQLKNLDECFRLRCPGNMSVQSTLQESILPVRIYDMSHRLLSSFSVSHIIPDIKIHY